MKTQSNFAFPILAKRLRLGVVAATICVASAFTPTHADEIEDMSRMVSLMGQFFSIMDSVYAAATNPEHMTLLHMNALEDLYKERGALDKVIPTYRDVLAKSQNPTVRRITYMRLADALKESGNKDEAIAVLKQAIDESVAEANNAR